MKNILKGIIIEDEEMATRHLNYLMQEIEGVEIISNFENGIKAIPLLNNNQVDFVLLDIETPDLNGLDFIKFSNNLPPIIFTTSNPNYAGEAIHLGAVDFLNKPVQRSYLNTAINKLKQQNLSKNSYSKMGRKDKVSNSDIIDINFMDLRKKENEDKELEQRRLNAILSWRNVHSRW